MKKIYMLAVMVIAIAITSCTKEATIPSIPTTDEATTQSGVSADADAPTTRAAIPVLTEVIHHLYNGSYVQYCNAMCLDSEENLYTMHAKGEWEKYNVNNASSFLWNVYWYDYFYQFYMPRSACVDAYNLTYFITPKNQLIKLNADPSASLNLINLTTSFPNDVVFLGLTAADNGNVFVTTGKSSDGEYGDTFPKHVVYRIASNGNVTEIATINAPVSATMVADWGGEELWWGLTVDHLEYPSILSKAKGTVLYGLDANGEIYKVSTTQGTVEYFTPRIPIKCLTTALNGNNPYVLSGNTIIEVRPTLAKDIVIGTIPEEIAAGAYTLRVNADATAFYVGVKSDIHYPFVSKFTVE